MTFPSVEPAINSTKGGMKKVLAMLKGGGTTHFEV